MNLQKQMFPWNPTYDWASSTYSKILKKSPRRRSVADTDGNTEFTATVNLVEDKKRSMKRRVSFARTLEVKEISRIADIAEKWPDSSTSDVDTTNISDMSKLSCPVPCKKPNHEPDISSLLSAPIVQSGGSTLAEVINANDSNMDLTTIPISAPTFQHQSPWSSAAKLNTNSNGDKASNVAGPLPNVDCAQTEEEPITIPPFLHRTSDSEADDIRRFFSSNTASPPKTFSRFSHAQNTDSGVKESESHTMELTCVKINQTTSADLAKPTAPVRVNPIVNEQLLDPEVMTSTADVQIRHLDPVIARTGATDFGFFDDVEQPPPLPKFLLKSSSASVSPPFFGNGSSPLHSSKEASCDVTAGQIHGPSLASTNVPRSSCISASAENPTANSYLSNASDPNNTVFLDESMQMTVRLTAKSTEPCVSHGNASRNANPSEDLEITCAFDPKWNLHQQKDGHGAMVALSGSAVVEPGGLSHRLAEPDAAQSVESLNCPGEATIPVDDHNSSDLDFTCKAPALASVQRDADKAETSHNTEDLSVTCHVPPVKQFFSRPGTVEAGCRSEDLSVTCHQTSASARDRNGDATADQDTEDLSFTCAVTSAGLGLVRHAAVETRRESENLSFTCNVPAVQSACASGLAAAEPADGFENLSFTCKVPCVERDSADAAPSDDLSFTCKLPPVQNVKNLSDSASATSDDAVLTATLKTAGDVENHRKVADNSSQDEFSDKLSKADPFSSRSGFTDKQCPVRSTINSNGKPGELLERQKENLFDQIYSAQSQLSGRLSVTRTDESATNACFEDAKDNEAIVAVTMPSARSSAAEKDDTRRPLRSQESSPTEEVALPKFDRLARARNSVGLYKTKLLSAGFAKHLENPRPKAQSPVSDAEPSPPFTAAGDAPVKNGRSPATPCSVEEREECAYRGASTEKNPVPPCSLPKCTEAALDNQPRKAHANRWPVSSKQVGSESPARGSATSPTGVDGDPFASVVHRNADEMFRSGLETSGDADDKYLLFEESPVIELGVGMKRSIRDLEASLANEEAVPAKKIERDAPESEFADKPSTDLKKANIAQSKEDAQTSQDPLSILTESLSLKKDLSNPISLRDFLIEHTDVRLGSFRKAPRGRRSTFVLPGSSKKPESLAELASTVFVHARSVPVYRQFTEAVQQRFKNYQEEIDKHEAAIKANNTELMMRIRSGPDDESDNLRTEVENLAANCTKLAKAGWKRSKSKLTKALCEVKAATNEKVLRPMVEELKKAGNVEELLSAAVAELELESAKVNAELQELESHKDLPSDKKISQYRKNKEEIAQLTNRLKELEERKKAKDEEQQERKEKMQKIWDLVDSMEKREQEEEMKRLKLKEDLKVQKRYLHWEILYDQQDKMKFGFLNKMLVVTVHFCPDDRSMVKSYDVENRMEDLHWMHLYHQVYNFVMRILLQAVDPRNLLILASGRRDLRKAVNFVSREAVKAKHLVKQLLEATSMITNVGLIFKKDSIVVDFDGDVPDLCSFQMEFVFWESDSDDEKRASFAPIKYQFIGTPSTYGDCNKEEILKAMNNVPSTSCLYFSKLVRAVISVISSSSAG